MENTNKEKKESASSKWLQYMVPIIVALIGLAGAIHKNQTDLKIQKSKEAHEKQNNVKGK